MVEEFGVGGLESHSGADGVEHDVDQLQHVTVHGLAAGQPAFQRNQHARHVHKTANLFQTTHA